MDRLALLSDTTELFVDPCEPEPGESVTIRFRTAKDDVQRVEYVMPGKSPVRMLRAFSDALFDYYEVKIKAGWEIIRYSFLVTGYAKDPEAEKEEQVYYNALGPQVFDGLPGMGGDADGLSGMGGDADGLSGMSGDADGLSQVGGDEHAFMLIPGFHVPDWAKGAVMYQIFPDRFCNGDTSNDIQDKEYVYLNEPVRHAAWDEPVRAFDNGCFYGGDLKGICDRLDYLQSLGVEVLYLNPVFDSPSSHGYDIRNYRQVSGHFGGNEALAMLCAQVHERGMKIVLDGVFNHSSIEHDWVRSHPEYYRKEESGEIECWWGMKTLPKLNYDDSEELKEEILEIAQYWLGAPYRIDGWRLDVAADVGHSRKVNHDFWRSFRKRVRECSSEALILAEHYGDPQEWLEGDEWDTVMNYDGFMDPVGIFFTGMEKHSDRTAPGKGDGRLLKESLLKAWSRMSGPSLYSAMNELDNHDHSRFLTRTGGISGRLEELGSEAAAERTDVSVLRQAVLMQFSLPGAPTVYYGDEAGVCGFTDPDNRRPYPWGKEDAELLRYYRELIHQRAFRRELRNGSIVWLAAEKDLVVYARITAGSKDIFVFHTGSEEKDVEIPVYPAGVADDEPLRGVMYTDCYDYGFRGETVYPEGGKIRIKVKKNSGIWLS